LGNFPVLPSDLAAGKPLNSHVGRSRAEAAKNVRYVPSRVRPLTANKSGQKITPVHPKMEPEYFALQSLTAATGAAAFR